ncbi:MAG: YbaB/EbfC family nucleoid-associated protein [candidate division WOR-3 bacterium]|nr:YbaB/EbfC family nucleoid-associated protein [candidate division WOR-3 bacterium]
MNMNKLMKQAQQMQKKMAEAQEKLKEVEIEVSVGGGMVTARMNGANELLSITIEDELINKEEKDMLMDLIVSAVNQANEKIEEKKKEEMGKVTGGMNIPGM